MKDGIQISFQDWKKFIEINIENYNIYAPIKLNGILDYEIIQKETIGDIVYNIPKPVSPLKIFYIPFKENVVHENNSPKLNLIIGVPSCDLIALDILDEIYLKEPYVDTYYKKRRENTILIGTDCFSIQDNCHCNAYDIKAYPDKNYDLSLSLIEDNVLLSENSSKGESILSQIMKQTEWKKSVKQNLELLNAARKRTKILLTDQNKELPGYNETRKIVAETEFTVWEKYAKTCVSCGACATICPTCTCFLLVDRPDFSKIRMIDACQYPGFTRIAAGEDLLDKRPVRFKNRYLCKYVWKPEKFESLACTGCGRCIETCIGNINKNELFIEQASLVLS